MVEIVRWVGKGADVVFHTRAFLNNAAVEGRWWLSEEDLVEQAAESPGIDGLSQFKWVLYASWTGKTTIFNVKNFTLNIISGAK